MVGRVQKGLRRFVRVMARAPRRSSTVSRSAGIISAAGTGAGGGPAAGALSEPATTAGGALPPRPQAPPPGPHPWRPRPAAHRAPHTDVLELDPGARAAEQQSAPTHVAAA